MATPSQHRSGPFLSGIVRLEGRWQIVENQACILSTRFVPFYWVWNVCPRACFALSTTVIFSWVCGRLRRARASVESGERQFNLGGFGIHCSIVPKRRGGTEATGFETGSFFNPPYLRLGSFFLVSQSSTVYNLSL